MQPRTIITKIKAVNASKNTNAFSSLERNNGVKSYNGMESTFVKKGRRKKKGGKWEGRRWEGREGRRMVSLLGHILGTE